MESPVVLDKPPEYHGNATNERGFPFDEEEGSGAWSELAARHPDIAARLRQRPATWARKRRPSSQDGIDDSNDFGGFDRFPFDDIPPEFREHFPSHWNRRYGPREEQFQPPQSPQPHSPQQQTAATQTEQDAGPSHDDQAHLPQYGLRNTVDLGQKSQPDPSVVDADERSHRSMSAPPDHRTVNQTANKMSGQNHQEPPHQHEQPSNVRHIPIFVEGRDEPVINKNVDHGTHFADTKPTYAPPPQPHIDREQYFADDGPAGFPFTKSFERPFFRQGPQPFTKQKMYPQAAAFNRGASPQRSQSPKPQTYHEPPRPETPSRSQHKSPPQQKQSSPQQRQPPPQPQAQQPPQPPQPRAQTPPQSPPPQHQPPSANDPITLILSIQTDVLNLMTDVENFKGTKKDKNYLFLDEMLTRNLIKLDNIETDGKENIRQARKEAIKCIQKCIAVLEAKADNKAVTSPQPHDVEMQNPESENAAPDQSNVQNGDVEMNDTKEEESTESKPKPIQAEVAPEPVPAPTEVKDKVEDAKKEEAKSVENKEADQPPIADIRPEEARAPEATSEIKPETQKTEEITEKKQTPKKIVKKRDKSKDKKEVANETKKEVVEKKEEPKKEENKEEKKDIDKAVTNETNENVNKEINDKQEIVDNKEKIEVMQVDANGKGEVKEALAMEVDGAASQ